MITNNFKIFTGILATIFVFSLGVFAQNSALGSKRWKLTHLNGRPVGETKAFMEIDPAEQRFNGSAGCNLMFGSVKITGRGIAFSRIGTTKMACSVNTGTLEGNVLRALEQATQYRLDGNNLNIYAGNRRNMKFKAEPKGGGNVPSNTKLEDKKWFLESIGNTAVGALGKGAFINFDAVKRSAGGNTSCNVFGGNYIVAGNSLSIKDVISTMRACIEDNRMNIERSFLDGLQKTNRYEIKDEKLYLYHGTELLLTLKGEKK